jgi:PHD/YefM family antitoxin component YafN of YafNO toxin-antitoxin module
MKIEYIRDRRGKPKAVQLPVQEWEKIVRKLRKYKQTLKLKSDLKEALDEVAQIRKSHSKKRTLTEVLNEL